MFVHVVCTLHRRGPHGVFAPLTHHMQDRSHQWESVGRQDTAPGYREEKVKGGKTVKSKMP